VLQPGSSVATSLSGGEAVEKKVILMEIMGDQYRTVPVPLHTTRPFIMSDVRLGDELDPLDSSAAQIEDFLSEKVMELIAQAKADPRFQNADRPSLPLIRLRVEHTGFPRVTNSNKFGQKFVGKLANPEEILLFAKQKAQATKGGQTGREEIVRKGMALNTLCLKSCYSVFQPKV
jgi:double-strand break repair protein MRE11